MTEVTKSLIGDEKFNFNTSWRFCCKSRTEFPQDVRGISKHTQRKDPSFGPKKKKWPYNIEKECFFHGNLILSGFFMPRMSSFLLKQNRGVKTEEVMQTIDFVPWIFSNLVTTKSKIYS